MLIIHQLQLLTNLVPRRSLLTRLDVAILLLFQGLQQHSSIEEAICDELSVLWLRRRQK